MSQVPRPELPANLSVLDGTDIAGAWKRFEVFEALHHDLDICNPMSSADLDRVVEHLCAPLTTPSKRAPRTLLDIACGTGELIARLGKQGIAESTGADFSPWMLVHADRRTSHLDIARSWVLGNAHHLPEEPLYDLVTCLGASWIWHGGRGTLRALAARTAPGGRIAMGEMYLRDGLDPASLAHEFGSFLTDQAIKEAMTEFGLTPIDRIDTADAAFDSYLQRTRAAAEAWAERYPGELSASHLATHDEWVAARITEAPLLTWSVWIAEKQP